MSIDSGSATKKVSMKKVSIKPNPSRRTRENTLMLPRPRRYLLTPAVAAIRTWPGGAVAFVV